MQMQNDIYAILQTGKATTEDALRVFDDLEPVDLDFMLGRWRGSGLHTGHPMDGMLDASDWYGKEFIDPDQVHPLLFLDATQQIYKVAPNPTLMNLALRFSFPRDGAFNAVLKAMSKLLKTETSQARLRMMEHRQKLSATMIYDHLPIHDIFRKVDDDTVLGVMDYKLSPRPFFFVLRRSDP